MPLQPFVRAHAVVVVEKSAAQPGAFPSPAELRDAFRAAVPDAPELDTPGFASTFDYSAAKQRLWNYSPVVALGGLGAALWYLKQQQNKQPVKKRQPVPAQDPALEKAADLQDIIDNIRWHLPKLRVPDTVAGGLAGAGVGGLYDLIRGKGKDGKRKTLQRVLTGALAGAGLSNVVGDRFRRYLANTKIPLGYRPTATQEIKPSFKRIWNAAILDKPDLDPDALRYWQQDGLRDRIKPLKQLPARMELVRRQFGLPVDKKNPWWQKNPEGYYSLNEKSTDYPARLATLFGTYYGDGGISRSRSDLKSGPEMMLRNPESALPAFSKNMKFQPNVYDFFGVNQVLGGMHLPYVKTPEGAYKGTVLDRWDVSPDKKEREYFGANLGKFLTDSKWRGEPLKDNLSWYVKDDSAGYTNDKAMKTIAGRWVWDNILSDELPWVGQKFEIAPRTTPYTFWESFAGHRAPHTLQFLRADNSPATDAMGYAALDQWDKQNR
jgi:hypothetical protein